MSCQQILNTAGLVLGMAGVGILFVYGPPQPTFEEGVGIGLQGGNVLADGRTVDEHDRDTRRLRDKHSFWSKAGLALGGVGFAIQLGATWWPVAG